MKSSIAWGLLAVIAVSGAPACGGSSSSGGGGGSAGSGGGATTGGASPTTGGSPATTGGAAGQPGSGGNAGDPGAGGAPPSNITVGTGCDPFTPCGGDLEGTWRYETGCIDYADLGFDLTQLTDYCAAATVEHVGSVTGTVTFDAGTVSRDASASVTTTVTLPAECNPAPALGCTAIQLGVREYFPEATCVADGTDCVCSGTVADTGWATETYTVTGNTLTLSSGRTFDFCQSGASLRYEETGAAPEPGVYELSAL